MGKKTQLNCLDKLVPKERGQQYERFFDNCKKGVPGKKGFPKFKKHQTHASVEYKTSGWKLSEEATNLKRDKKSGN